MIEKAINNILVNDATVTDITTEIYFGANPYINPAVTPTNNPYLGFYRNATEPYDTKTSRSTLDLATIHINMFAKTAMEVADLAQAVRGALDRNSGTYASIKVQSVQFKNESTGFEYTAELSERGIFQITHFYACRVEPIYT